jgi:Reeler domain
MAGEGRSSVWHASVRFVKLGLRGWRLCAVGLLGAALSAAALARPTGAPVCAVTPDQLIAAGGHTVVRAGNGGFALSAPLTYTGSSPITVTVSGGNAFKGVLLWAVDASGQTAQGAWTIPSGFRTPSGCTSASITHSSDTVKGNSVSLDFTPVSVQRGPITFKAAIVVSRFDAAFPTEATVNSNDILNVDGDTSTRPVAASTDGLLVLRYLLGFRGDALIGNARAPTASRDATAVVLYLNSIRASLDVDSDGVVSAHTDGLMIHRYFNGLRGAALVTGLASPTLSPQQLAQIEAKLAALF